MADHSKSLAAAAARLKSAALYAPAQKAGLDNPDWEGASSRFLVVRLSPFRDASRSTGHLFLHRLVRRTLGPDAYIDFSFFPSKSDRAILDAAGIPYLCGIGSGRGLEDYDAVLVSCAYALELPNLPLLLRRSAVPLRASARRKAGGYPPLILGGSNALASQALIFPDGDSFVDGLFFGEGEAGGERLVSTLAEAAAAARRAGTTLDAAAACANLEAELPSFWASCRGAPEEPRQDGRLRRVEPGRFALADGPTLLDSYPLLNSEEASTARLQISWGCPSFCSFCFEGWERKPYRELPKEEVLAAALSLKRESGASTADLYSFNFNAHQDALSLMLELNRVFDRVNMMSQRADLLVRTPGMIACELAAEKRSFTVGVEGISAGMRSYYSKDLRDEDLRALLERLAKEKVRELKLFYILSGLETEADLAEFRASCAELRAFAELRHPGLRAVFSFGFLVRMPFTPLRAEPLVLDRAVFRPIEAAAKAAVEEAGFEYRLAADWDEYVADQLLVSGGYSLAAALEAGAEEGCAFDLRIEGDLQKRLIDALLASGELVRDADGSLSGPLAEAKGADYRYPLGFVDAEVSPSFREAALSRARARTDTPSCLGDNDARCQGCAACADEGERDFLTGHRVKGSGGTALPERIAELIRAKRRAAPLHFSAELPGTLAGAEDEFLSAWLLRALLRADPGLSASVYRVEEALRTSAEWRDRLPPGFTGRAVLAVRCGEGADPERIARAFGGALGAGVEYLEAFAADWIEGVEAVVDTGKDAQGAAAAARRWLSALKLAATERKTETGRAFDIAPKDRKKRVVEEARTEGGAIVVSGGAKVDFSPLLPKPEDRAAARARIIALRGRRWNAATG